MITAFITFGNSNYLSFALYTLGFLLEKTTGYATHETQVKIIGGQPVDIRYRPSMVNITF